MAAGPTSSLGGKLQWVAIIFTAVGLFTSIHFHIHSLQTARMENELFSYLQLDERYNKLIFTLIDSDPDVFKKVDDLSLKNHKFIMYELFNLFETVESLRPHYQELDLWPNWQKRMEFLFSKPAIQYAWQKHRRDADQIYHPEFIARVDSILASP